MSQSSTDPLSQQSTTQSSLLGIEGGETQKEYGISIQTIWNSSVVRLGKNTNQTSVDFDFKPWFKVSKNWTMSAELGMNKDLRNEQKYTLKNSSVSFSNQPIRLSSNFNYRAKLTALIPTQEEERKVSSLQTGLNLTNRFYLKNKAMPNLVSYYQLGLIKNFYRYQTTGLGESNYSYGLSHSACVVYPMGRFYASMSGGINQKWTYRGTPKALFSLEEEVGMNLGSWSIAFGHSNGDSLYQSNGKNLNWSVFDRDTSNYYLMVAADF